MSTFEQMEQDGFWSIWPRLGNNQVNEWTIERAAEIIADMTEMVHFTALLDADDNHLGNIQADCEAIEDESAVHRPFQQGCKSRIRIAEQEYSSLVQLIKEKSSCTTSDSGMLEPISLIVARFSIALNLVHGLGHVSMKAGIGWKPKELCYMSSPIMKAGWEVEL